MASTERLLPFFWGRLPIFDFVVQTAAQQAPTAKQGALGKRSGPVVWQPHAIFRALLLLPVIVACSSANAPAVGPAAMGGAKWLSYQYGAANNAVVPGPRTGVSWHTTLGGKVNGGLSYGDGRIYVDSFDRHLYALNAKTGRVEWSAPLGGVAMNTPVLADGVVVVGTGTNRVMIDTPNQVLWGRPGGDNVLAFNAMTGAPLWRYHTVGEDMPSAAIVIRAHKHPEVVFSNGDGFVRSLDLITGKRIWKSYLNGVATMSSLESYKGKLFGIENFSIGFIFANINNPLRLRYATKAWEMQSRNGQLVWTIPYGNSDCSPTVANGTMFFQSSKLVYPISSGNTLSYSIVYAVDIATGRVLWRARSGSGERDDKGSNENAIAGMYHNHTYFTGLPFEKTVAAFNASTGKLRWKISTQGAVKMSPLAIRKRLLFGDTDGYFYVVSARDGRLIKKLKFPKFFTTSPPIAIGMTIYIANDKQIYAIPLRNLLEKSIRLRIP